MSKRFKKIISSFVLVSLIGFYFVSPFTVKKADAFLGIGDITFNTTMGDIPRFLADTAKKVLEFGFKKLKKRMLTQIQNDLVNWVQGGGEPRFIKDLGKFVKDNAEYATVSTIDKFFNEKGVDICSPFKANVQLLINRTKLLQEEQMKCSLGDIKDNLENFANNFEDGGWTTWLKLHETRNTLPGAYLASSQLIGAQAAIAGNTAQAKITAGKGFLDQKKCSIASYAHYNLEFYETDGTSHEIDLEQVPASRDILRSKNFEYDWATIWGQIFSDVKISIDQVDINSIRLIPTGESTKEPIDPPGNVPAGATCAKEEVITPGSIVGDWVGGGLEKLGIDALLNANDITSILDAVLDAAVNRAAREGLSYMKSGRGSYTTPLSPRSAAKTQQQLVGLESTDAVSLQNQMIDLRNASTKLKLETQKLTKSQNLDKFNQRLVKIAGYYEGSTYIPGSVVTLSPTDLRTVRAKDSDKKFSDAADRFFAKANSALFYESGGGYVSFPDGLDFVKESNNPGVYLSNRETLKKLSSIWKAINSVFSDLGNTTKSCYEVRYTLEPEIITNNSSNGLDTLPFMVLEDGNAVAWASHEDGYAKRIYTAVKDKDMLSADNVKNYFLSETFNAGSKSEEFLQLADSYDSLTENAAEVISGLEDDIKFVSDNMPNVLKYTSILFDYDNAGKDFSLIKKIKSYNEIIGNKNKTYTVESTGEVLTHQEAVEKFYNELIEARKQTMNKWLALAPSDKQEIIGKAKSLIESSLEPDSEDTFKDAAGDTIQNTDILGITAAEAIAEAMNLNVEGLVSELEERQVKIGKQQTDVSNKLGKFIDNNEDRKRAMLEGGDSEWEKHFKNRMQLVYAAFIYDFYKNRYTQEFCK